MISQYRTGRLYDSRLYTARVSETRNADLVLTVRLFMGRVDPPGDVGTVRRGPRDDRGRRTPVDIVPWENTWEPWLRNFEETVEAGYRNRLWLRPDGWWGAGVESGGTHWVPNVKCGLQIRYVDRPDQAHVVSECVRLRNPGDRATSTMSRTNRVLRLDDQDIELQLKHRAEGHDQVPALHEIGHLLGLSHVECTENERECYGRTEHQRGDLMGWGERLEAWHAWPWQRRLRDHGVEPAVGWSATASRPTPFRWDWGRTPVRWPGGAPGPDAGVGNLSADPGP